MHLQDQNNFWNPSTQMKTTIIIKTNMLYYWNLKLDDNLWNSEVGTLSILGFKGKFNYEDSNSVLLS